MSFLFPSDDRSNGVPPPTVIHAVTGPQMSVSELRDIVREGTANSTSRSRAGYASSGSVLSEKLSYLSLRPSVGPSVTNGRPLDIFITILSGTLPIHSGLY